MSYISSLSKKPLCSGIQILLRSEIRRGSAGSLSVRCWNKFSSLRYEKGWSADAEWKRVREGESRERYIMRLSSGCADIKTSNPGFQPTAKLHNQSLNKWLRIFVILKLSINKIPINPSPPYRQPGRHSSTISPTRRRLADFPPTQPTLSQFCIACWHRTDIRHDLLLHGVNYKKFCTISQMEYLHNN